VNYLYDGDGRRVAKVGSKLYWYDGGSEILAETDAAGNTQNEYIFFGGQRIAVLPAAGNPSYYVEDLLGTSRVITSNTGVVCYDADFYPYGGERPYTNTCPQNYKFEGKERDTETGNDDFGARYYSNRFGRWLSADWSSVPVPVPYANLSNPQTLNLYAMVSDDPETSADLDGHYSFGPLSLPGIGGEGCRNMKLCENTEKQDQSDKQQAQQTAQNQQQEEEKNQKAKQDPQKSDIVLPDDPSKLGPEWKRDPGYKNPNGERWVNPNGDSLEFEKGRPGFPGWRGKDHWHWGSKGEKEKKHYRPGDTIRTYGPAVAKAAATVAVGAVILRTIIIILEGLAAL